MHSQSDPWFENTENCSETKFIIEHFSDNNHIVAYLQGIRKTCISIDNGESWIPLKLGDKRVDNVIQYEGDSHDLFLNTFREIYKYDTELDTTTLFFDFSPYGWIDQGLIQSNGNIVIVSTSSSGITLRYFSSSAELINSIEILVDGSRPELIYQEGFPIYITASASGSYPKKVLWEFDIETFTVGEEIEVPNHGSGIKYLNGKLFSSNFFSTDGGKTWDEVTSTEVIPFVWSIDIKNNYVVLNGRNNIHLSEDSGESFRVISPSIEEFSGLDISFNDDESIFISSRFSSRLIHKSDDLGATWQQFQNTLSLPNSYRITVSEEDHILANSVNCGTNYFSSNVWNESLHPLENRTLFSFAALPNNNIIALDLRDVLLSEDYGATWSIIETNIFESGEIIIKEGVAYIPWFGSIVYSTDNGKSYNFSNNTNSIAGYFADLKVLKQEASGDLSIYDLNDGSTINLNITIDPVLNIDIASEWSGTNFHILEYADSSKNRLLIKSTINEGLDLVSRIIPINPDGEGHQLMTDHNGNIIVYNENQVLLSQDKGENWMDLTPAIDDIWFITDVSVSYDNYLYISTLGTGVLKNNCPIDSDISSCSFYLADNDNDGYLSDVDCDDNDPTINPGANDIPNNQVDENCDGTLLVIDNDNDGFHSDEDCDDNDPAINPAANDIPNNEVDENCDGSLLVIDNDNDGFHSDEDCNDNDANINPGANDIPNNQVDENCDGSLFVIDNDNDGFHSDEDCDDNDPAINPAANDIPNNEVDENCDGSLLVIDNDNDGFHSDEDCNDNDPAINPAANDIPNNEVDENCDGSLFVIDNDNDGFHSDEDCDDNDASINPGALDIVENGIDEDCDGEDKEVSHKLGSSFRIYPNPTSSYINFELTEHTDVEFTVCDLYGKQVFQAKDVNQIDVTDLIDGVYILKIMDLESQEQVTKRIIVAK